MIRKQANNIFWYEFELLQPFPYVRHGCLPRSSMMNLHLENPTTAQHSRHQMATALFGTSAVCPISMHQVHGTHVTVVSSSSSPVGDSDGLATSLCNIGLIVVHADCQAAVFFDPEHQVIANVHSGWRGSVQNIYKATIERLQKEWGTRPEALIACVSPSLGPCHAEFRNWQEELPPSFVPFRCQGNYFDFWEISRHQLLSCGLIPSHIEMARMCTYCHPDLFFSYRRDKTSERNLTCIALMDHHLPNIETPGLKPHPFIEATTRSARCVGI